MTSLSLLREKFTIREKGQAASPTVALGNRFVISLPNHPVPLIVRGHSMHVTLRFGAEIMRQLSYLDHVENVKTMFQWEEIWSNIIKPFEQDHMPNTWIVVYYKGSPIFHDNFHHGFFDVIEQCEFKNNMSGDRYEKSIAMAQQAFQKMDRDVTIEEESHVGFILDASDFKQLRFAIILRMPGHQGTFITRLSENKDYKIRPTDYIAMALAADYIEAVNMAVRAGFIEKEEKKQKRPRPLNQNPEKKHILKRLNTLSMAIDQAETKYTIHYRPERPDFTLIQEKCASL